MKYPAPRKLLNYLASHGPSAVQVEALAMLGRPDLPTTFPAFPRGSRENFLRRLAANPKKATSARLGALKELLHLMLGETAPEPRSERSTVAAEHPQGLPTASEAMLRALGRKHLGELSDEEYGRYSSEFGWVERLELERQRGEWFCPDAEILVLLGLTRLTFWQGVRDRAKTDDVRHNAHREIKRLEGGDGHLSEAIPGHRCRALSRMNRN
jgi:hypothetical protein